jgi:hypothetical protein
MQLTLEEARVICAKLQQAAGLSDDALEVIKSNDSIGMTEAYVRLVAQFLGHSYANILAPIWAQFPELKPPELKQPHKQPTSDLSAASLAAINDFLQAAAAALAHAERVLKSNGSNALPYGGLPELKDSIAEIAAFRNRPRLGDMPSAGKTL